MKKNAYLIFNPVAGRGNADLELEEIQKQLEPYFELEIEQTTIDTSAAVLTQKAIEAKVDLVIASGGDGTVSEVAGVLVNTKIALGIIPRGTANAFAFAMEIPTDIPGACAVLTQGRAVPIDIGSCNNYPLLLLAGVGFEAETVEQADRKSKDRFGSFAYILSAISQLQNLNFFEVEIETPEDVISCRAVAITIANAAPATSVLAQGPATLCHDDGLLDVTIFAPETAFGAMAASYHLLQSALQNQAAERQDIGYFRAKSLTLKADPPQKVVVDGEIIGTTPIQVKCIPNGLMLMKSQAAPEEVLERLVGLPELKIQHKPTFNPI